MNNVFALYRARPGLFDTSSINSASICLLVLFYTTKKGKLEESYALLGIDDESFDVL